MMKTRHAGRHAARLLLVGAMSAGLAACGGGSGDSDPIDTGDFDIFDPDDRNNNGVPDVDDPDFDPSDVDGDMIQNNRDPDIDGDGLDNEEDDDIDGDGILNVDDTDADGDGFDEPTASDVCGSAAGTDADSSNFDWNDNCTVRRLNQFSDSLYSAGIQRIVYCAGFGTENAGGVDGFVDGEYGPGTEQAVTDFQTAYNTANPDGVIGVDGQVGPQTWTALQAELDLVTPATIVAGGEPFYDSYGVQGERCGDTVLFLNEVRNADDGLSIDRLGWQLAKGATDPTPVPFSVAMPFGVID